MVDDAGGRYLYKLKKVLKNLMKFRSWLYLKLSAPTELVLYLPIVSKVDKGAWSGPYKTDIEFVFTQLIILVGKFLTKALCSNNPVLLASRRYK